MRHRENKFGDKKKLSNQIEHRDLKSLGTSVHDELEKTSKTLYAEGDASLR